MSDKYQLPPEFELPPGTRAAHRRLLEVEVGGARQTPLLLRRRTVLAAAALALAAVLVAPAFGLGQKLVGVLTPWSPPARPSEADERRTAEKAGENADATTRTAGARTVPERKSVAPERKSLPPKQSGPRAAGHAAPPPDASPGENAVSAERRCEPGAVPGIIAGERRCLRAGKRCERGHDREYHRYRFHCHAQRLTAYEADLSLTMTAAPDAVLLGDALEYTLTVRNQGPDALPHASVIADLPAGAAQPFEVPDLGRCKTEQGAAPRVVCVLPAMARGAIARITLLAHAQAAGALTSRATLVSSADPRSANDSATTATSVRQGFVRGSGTYNHVGGTFEFEVDAVGGTNGHGRGTFSYRRTYRGQTQEARGHVVCVRVDGNQARVMGIVDASNGVPIHEEEFDPTERTGVVAVGHGASFAFTDGAERGADTAFGFAPNFLDPASTQKCPLLSGPPLTKLTGGDFAVGLLP